MRVCVLCLSLYVRIDECVSRAGDGREGEEEEDHNLTYIYIYIYMYVCPFLFLVWGPSITSFLAYILLISVVHYDFHI